MRTPQLTAPRRRAPGRLAFATCLLAGLAAPEGLLGQDTTVATAGAQDTPVGALLEELREAERRVDDVEQNLAVATDALAELFEFQRRERWREHHQILLRVDLHSVWMPFTFHDGRKRNGAVHFAKNKDVL